MKKLTGVRGSFCASHYSPEGALHGHSYLVWAWFPAGEDAVRLQARLALFLGDLDHEILPPGWERGEDMAERLARLVGASRVIVERPVEGIAAEWCAE